VGLRNESDLAANERDQLEAYEIDRNENEFITFYKIDSRYHGS